MLWALAFTGIILGGCLMLWLIIPQSVSTTAQVIVHVSPDPMTAATQPTTRPARAPRDVRTTFQVGREIYEYHPQTQPSEFPYRLPVSRPSDSF